MVASSNYGNLDTICRAMDTIAEQTAAAGSAMDLPNASSNVIASSVAIRFGLRGPNLMLCNGATSGLDAVHWAATLIRGGRASRALVLGVEPDNEAVRAFTGGARTVDGAAALVVESEQSAAERGANAPAVLGDYVRGAGLGRTLERLAKATGDRPALWHLPEQRAAAVPDTLWRAWTGTIWPRSSGWARVRWECSSAPRPSAGSPRAAPVRCTPPRAPTPTTPARASRCTGGQRPDVDR